MLHSKVEDRPVLDEISGISLIYALVHPDTYLVCNLVWNDLLCMLCQEYFDPIVSNVANSYRLQEECDVFLGWFHC